MFYSYFNSETGMRPAYGTSITYSGAQSTVQAIQQALQMQQQLQMQRRRCTTVLFIRRVFLPSTSSYTVRKFFSDYSIWDCIQLITSKE